jgi:hypothetical protein
MNASKLMGVGCFAKPDRLSKVFKRAVESYVLGEVVEFDNHMDYGGSLLNKIVASIPNDQWALESGKFCNIANKRITGFFLGFNNQGLNLSVFMKGDSLDRERFTARLDGLTRLRNKRLN